MKTQLNGGYGRIGIKRFFSSSGINQVLEVKKRSLGKTLSLDEFLFRKQVLETYRSLIRLCYKSHERYDLIKYVREEFRINDKENDIAYRKYLLSSGKNKINQMIPILGISTTKTF